MNMMKARQIYFGGIKNDENEHVYFSVINKLIIINTTVLHITFVGKQDEKLLNDTLQCYLAPSKGK